MEREVSQYLWPGCRFAGGAKRPALEDEDVRGEDAAGRSWWGEIKSRERATITSEGGDFKVLSKALDQCLEAIKRNEHNWPLCSRCGGQGFTQAPKGYILTNDKPSCWECKGTGKVHPFPFSVLCLNHCPKPGQRLVMLYYGPTRIVMTLADFKARYIDCETLPEAEDL